MAVSKKRTQPKADKDEYVNVPIRLKDMKRLVEGDVPVHVCNVVSSMLDAVPTFRPGIYRHYKGGLYRALHLVEHHETGQKLVVYVSMEKGSLHLREYDDPNADSWTDLVHEKRLPAVRKTQERRFDFMSE
jgi:hypothetical protein